MSTSHKAGPDFWNQIFGKMASSESATIVDVDYDEAADEARLRAGLSDAGWSGDEIEFRLKLHKQQEDSAPTTSPGVYPHVEFIFARLCDDVEAAMRRQNMNSQARVTRGIEPRAGASPSKINVVMTDESIITVGSFFFRYCGLIARAFTRTLHRSPHFWESSDFNHETARSMLKADHDLWKYWLRIFVSFGVTGTHTGVPFLPSKRHEVLLFEQVARAMEIFAVAHEYGHHQLNHGRAIDGNFHSEEFDADQFALRMGYEVERKPLFMHNPYLASGAGGVILLLSLSTLSGVEARITGIPVEISLTHPSIEERLSKFDSVAVLRPKEFANLKNFRTVSARVLKTVQAVVFELLNEISSEQLKKLSQLRFDVSPPT